MRHCSRSPSDKPNTYNKSVDTSRNRNDDLDVKVPLAALKEGKASYDQRAIPLVSRLLTRWPRDEVKQYAHEIKAEDF